MNLSQLMAAGLPGIDALRNMALVFDGDLCQRLVNVQAWHGDPRHVPKPPATNDGRWMLRADVLTECRPGGIIWGGFSHLDSSGFVGIEVLDASVVFLADPQPPQLTPEPRP
jgi:hypothetical protein